MKKSLLIGVGGLILVLGLVGALSLKVEEPKPLMPLSEEGEYYSIGVQEPEPYVLKEAADLRARTTIHQALKQAIEQFKADSGVESMSAENAAFLGLGEERKYSFGAEYDVYQGKKTISYVYRVYMDTLGAHPNHFFVTFTFDQEGKELALDDLFADKESYLTRLSVEAFARVVEELQSRTGEVATQDMEDTVRMGTAPSPEALQFFYLTDTDLHLLFPPYQVAAYAAGSFDIAVPLTGLSDILKPEFR